MSDEGRRIQADLEDAEAAVAEQDRLRRRLTGAERERDRAHGTLVQARDRLARESADVHALESFSPTRIWAALRGSRGADLSREQAEEQAADYAVAAASEEHERAVARVDDVRRALAALTDGRGDPEAQRDAVLARKERWLVRTEGDGAGELTEIATRVGVVRAQLVEVVEADHAAVAAGRGLGAAMAMLDKAHGWATVDTFFDGGFLTDSIKYDRMDQAQRLLADCDRHLKALTRELGDVSLEGLDQLRVTDLTRTFDVWFDNIFSDWSVRNRINDARRRTDGAVQAVAEVRVKLRGRREEIDWELGDLARRRTALLAAAASG